MSVKAVKWSFHRYRAARPCIPNALTMRPMPPMEARAIEGALRAINTEWTKLRKAPPRDESRVKDLADAAYEARKRGE